jgi:hypothetical protein
MYIERHLVEGIGKYKYGDEVSSSAVSKLEKQEIQWLSSSPKVIRPETQEEPMFHFKPECKKRPMSQFRCSQAEEFSGPFVPFWLSID